METKHIYLDNFLPYFDETSGRSGLRNHPEPMTVEVLSFDLDDNYEYLITTDGTFQRAVCYAESSPYGWNRKTKEPEKIQ